MSNFLLRSTLNLGQGINAGRSSIEVVTNVQKKPRKRAAIVGSGFGGIAAAIRLQAAGIETVLFEARDQPGGCAYVYKQDGFVFDGGPTVITAPACLEELFALAGKKLSDYVELIPVHPMYRLIWEDDTVLNYDVVEGQMEREITRIAPNDLAGYRAFVDYARRVFEKGYSELAAQPFSRFHHMLRVAPEMIRLRADRSVYAAVSRFVRDERLRQALSFHSLLVGGNPFDTSAIYTLIHYLERNWGVYFARGGTGSLVQGLLKLYQELGGQLRLRMTVETIDVRTVDGNVVHEVQVAGQPSLSFDLVVSNADLHRTYASLYRHHPKAAGRVKHLEKMHWSMSLFVMYFGTRRRYSNLAHHTILFGQRYEKLLRDIFHGPTLAEDFSLYLHAPTVTDPSLAPPGCEAFYVLSPVPHLGNAAIDWESMKEAYGERILTSLERILPDLRREIVTKRIMTPADFQSQLGTWQGAAFSVSPTLLQSAYFRPHNRDRKIPGLYIVGAGTHPGAGIPGVINSAKATAGSVLADLERVSQA